MEQDDQMLIKLVEEDWPEDDEHQNDPEMEVCESQSNKKRRREELNEALGKGSEHLPPIHPDNGPFGKEATQDEFLYDDRWTKEVDNLFIDLLVEAHFGLEWRNDRPGSNVFAYCRGVLVIDLGENFTVAEVEERFDFLHKRF
ncbi:sentrin-specific protease 1 [Striga asiatica]|uniref:Sentrin-specific protease 1 n=1 Tax=Striga asiatica TaxID=4170 RepID=A0A5A7RBL9_STRAF|nr:sentrin-specific protease 1 [Striga asiatica]